MNTEERKCLIFPLVKRTQNKMKEYQCYICGKKSLTKDEVGLTKKIIDKKTSQFYCLHCLAEQLEVTEDELLAKVEEFKAEGCTLFN